MDKAKHNRGKIWRSRAWAGRRNAPMKNPPKPPVANLDTRVADGGTQWATGGLGGAARLPQLLPLIVMLVAMPASAQPAATDPDWPCAQTLVPKLTAGAYWDGKVPANPKWRDNETLFPMVTDIVDRDTPDADGLARLNAYVDTIPLGQRATALPLLFSAIVDQTNDERTLLIQRIKQLGLRQRRMGDVVAKISTEADNAAASDPKQKDLAGERDFDIRAFQETQRTMRYACEAPVAMERRLGNLARDLQHRLKAK